MPSEEATCSFDQDLFTYDGEGVFYNINVTRWRWLSVRLVSLGNEPAARVFAAGNARSGSTKRLPSVVGEVSRAVKLAHQYLADAGVQDAKTAPSSTALSRQFWLRSTSVSSCCRECSGPSPASSPPLR